MSKDPTAHRALAQRRMQLMRTIEMSTRERDRYQGSVNSYQRSIDEAVAEVNSIDDALSLLDAAVEYASDQPQEEA